MRNILLTLAPVVFLSTAINAQGVFSNKTQAILEKVIQDYPNHFYNIKGEFLGQALQTTRYRSTVQLPGAASSMITLATTSSAGTSDWTCRVLESSAFSEAKSRYAEIYGQISNSIITAGNQKTFILSGQYEEPSEDKKYTHIVFSLLPAVGDMKKLKVDLLLQEENKGWNIILSVQDAEEPQVAVLHN